MKLNIGNNIRTLRRSRDMTQDELAAKLGVTFQTVSRWENGGSYPDIEFLPAIADVFDITVDHLLDRDRDSKCSHLCMLIDDRLHTAVRERDPETACGATSGSTRNVPICRGCGTSSAVTKRTHRRKSLQKRGNFLRYICSSEQI